MCVCVCDGCKLITVNTGFCVCFFIEARILERQRSLG